VYLLFVVLSLLLLTSERAQQASKSKEAKKEPQTTDTLLFVVLSLHFFQVSIDILYPYIVY